MEMDDDLEQYIQEQRARVAEDKANLEQDLPYMEIRAKDVKTYDPTIKENIPPFKRSTVQGKDESCCLSLPLGEDYERKKQKLQQELRLDYRRYMAQKKHLDAGEPVPSLPLGESRTAKEHLASLRAPQDLPDVLLHSPRPPLHPDRAPSRRDAATLTEGRRGAHRARGLGELRGLWPEDDLLPPQPQPQPQPHRGRTRLVRVELDSEEEEEDSEEELDLVERRRPRQTGLEPALPERRRQRQRHYKTDCNRDLSRFRDRRVELSDDYLDPTLYGQRHGNDNRERKETDGSVAHEEEYLDARHGTSSQTPKPKLQVTAGTRGGGRSRSSTSKDEAEFATGLMIGSADSDAALRKRKERYRQELQEQIAEQQRNRRREKELELRAAATAVTDPERQPDRVKPLGSVSGGGDPDRARQRRDIPYRPGQALELPGEDVNRRPTEDRDRERLPPVQPRVAFQSPMLEYSAALGLGLGSGGMSPYNQAFPRSMDTPRHPGFIPHPPSTMADAYRTPYDDAYLYYGARNQLDPSLPYYGHVPFTGGVQQQPMSYLALPPGGAHPSRMTPHSPHSLGCHSEPPPHRPASDAANMNSGIGVFPGEKTRPSRESVLTYKEALKQQIQERQERRRLEREESDRYEAKIEADLKAHDPWGRGGGGAPLRDSRGNLITDLHQMHKNNEEAYSNPDTWQKRATATMVVPREEERPPSTHSGFAHAATPQFARGSVFTNQPTPQQLHEQDKYKTYLKQQIEEKRLKEAEERERLKQEEEKEERRLAEQRARIQREYEEEQERKKRKEMEQKAKNEELIRLAEERRKEVERKKKEVEEKENAAMRKEYERERQARMEEVRQEYERERDRQARMEEAPRQASPPIPTHQRHAPQYTPRPPSVDSRRSTAPLSERSLSGLQSPPVPARRNQLRAAEDQRGVISELSALRRQLRSEQKRVEGQLLQADWDDLDSLGDRHSSRKRPPVDVFDMARLRLQAPVRRPSSRCTEEPGNLHRIHDSLQLRYTDHDSRETGHGYPSPPRERDRDRQVDRQMDIQRQADYREQQRRVSSLRRKPADDYFDLLPPQHHNHYLGSGGGDPMRGSLLESESAFIDPMGDAFPVPPSPEERTPHPQQLSARERRRLAKRNDSRNERGVFREPIGQPDNYSLQSEGSVSVEVGRERNGYRTRRLLGLTRHGRRTGDLSDDDDDDEDEEDESPQVSPRCPDRGRSSVETVATEPWLRPGTSETLKRLMTSQTPRERDRERDRLTSRGTGVQDWDGPSTYHG